MYPTLYQLAGYAMLGWLLLLLLPAWRVTRWAAATAVFPLYLSLLYAIGIVPLVVEAGPGIMRDFGNMEGVLGLLRDPDVALIAWIHILAFDQVVALLIYRDNMEHRYVPLPVQSVFLFLTLMFGPVGLLAYWAARSARRAAAGRRASAVAGEERGGALATPAPLRQALAAAAAGLRRERLLTGLAGLALAAAAVCGAAIVVRGTEFVAPEGHLAKAASFDLGVAVYLLTVALYLPHARFTERGGRWWRGAVAAVFLYSVPLETVQILRGLDPRFTAAGSPLDQLLGAVFGVVALGIVGTFGVLAWKVARAPGGGATPLGLSLRYGLAAAGAGFAAGVWMSVVRGSASGAASILPLHAAGFHGMQAVPVVALLLAWAGMDAARARAWVHAAGAAWLAAVAALAWQAAAGLPLTEPAAGSAAAVAALLAWASVAGAAALLWLRPAGVLRAAPAGPSDGGAG